MSPPPATDLRVEYISALSKASLKVSEEKWNKMMSTEDQKKTMIEFFDKPVHQLLVILENAAGSLTMHLNLDVAVKQKAVFFLKYSNCVITAENYRDNLICGDLSPDTLEQLQAFVDEKALWLFNAHSGRNNFGPLLRILRITVIQWTRQIQEVLEQESTAKPGNQNAEPIKEIGFWTERHRSLRLIEHQLDMTNVKLVVAILEKTRSSYVSPFKEVMQEVRTAVVEAQDIRMNLAPLVKIVQDLESKDLPGIKNLLHPLIHSVAFSWKNCHHLRIRPSRIGSLIRCIANLLIRLSQQFLDSSTLFRGELEDSDQKVQTVLEMIAYFLFIYGKYRDDITQFIKGDVPPWNFEDYEVFKRLNVYIERLQMIKEIFGTAAEYLKLEKVEVGGIHGFETCCLVKEVYQEFLEELVIFDKCLYDVLDPDVQDFLKDMEKFRKKVTEFDYRVGTIVRTAICHCFNTEGVCKVVQVFSFLMTRKEILRSLNKCLPEILVMAHEELNHAMRKYQTDGEALKNNEPLVYWSLPPTARLLQWVLQLKNVISVPITALQSIKHLFEKKEGIEVLTHKYNGMMILFSKMGDDAYQKWSECVPDSVAAGLNQPLLKRSSDGCEIHVNFDDQLKTIILEVKHLIQIMDGNVPDAAAQLYSQREALEEYRTSLRQIADWYNDMKRNLLGVEVPLVVEKMHTIDKLLTKGENSIFWSTEGVNEYLNILNEATSELYRKMNETKTNIRMIQEITEGWSKKILIERREGKPGSYVSIEERTEAVTQFYPEVEADGIKIHAFLKKNLELYEADECSETWTAYMNFADELVTVGLFKVVRRNLCFFLENTLSNIDYQNHIFEIQLDVMDNELVFVPPLDIKKENNFKYILETFLNGVFKVSSLVKRVSTHRLHSDYLTELEQVDELMEMRREFMKRVDHAVQAAKDKIFALQCYSYLWRGNRKEVIESLGAVNNDGQQLPLGNLAQVKEQIDNCEKVRLEVENIPNYIIVDKWLYIHQSPFKRSLITCVDQWSLCFKGYIMECVVESLNELDSFIQKTEEFLQMEIESGNSESLVTHISHIQSVRDRRSVTDSMFTPIKEAIHLLQGYGEHLPDMVHYLLQTLPERWATTKKMAETAKQQISSLISHEAAAIRQKVVAFSTKQIQFREWFRQSPAFQYNCEKVEEILVALAAEIQKLELEITDLSKFAKLFEVHIPSFTQLKQCDAELVLLRQLWEYIFSVRSQIAEWEKTAWIEVDLDALEIQCKSYMRDIKSMDKEMRNWDAFCCLENTVKNLLVALKAVHQLRNPAVRGRHWQQLTDATKVPLTMDDTTTLAQLLSLNLHKFEDVVHVIVEKAVKEMAMERVLKELEQTWSGLHFEKSVHPRTGHLLLKISENLIEILEDNQVQLQNLMSSKHISHFLEEISTWQRSLSQVESFIGLWLDVQRTWLQMESIFTGSQDIRTRLPDDCNRFDSINKDFKELVADVTANSNVLEVANRTDVHQKLEQLHDELSICEKALTEYLETKRRVFPRFYFVSSADLLDILSNGSQPRLIMRHLPKLFDSVSQLIFNTPDDEDKVAVGMMSKDGEEVMFNKPCECVGPVEIWLHCLLQEIISTIHLLLGDAVVTYEDRLREHWMFDYPAQVALTAAQIWWASEVASALSRLEEGYENSLKEYNKKQMQQLNVLIGMLLGEMTPGNRQKVMTVCTVDVHARDVVYKLITQRVDNVTDFTWQSQLRHRWDSQQSQCFINICDAQFGYCYEYLGNTARLVITPLTDRCFITLTQSLHLMMGGAPTGPAGTGKTETVKDLGRALGMMVYVFNCSEQLDYKSCANIYKGLAQTGAWGCFDEFNRISVEVLSVIAVQVKCIQDALKAKKNTFRILGDEVLLKDSVGIFITMNPGYAGRTELPENLKALFRPCAMVAPDSQLICEIMLVAEGFVEARNLGHKFTTLYSLCKELLSKQDHYDWGLRAIKSVLVVAGSLKRSNPSSPEEHILMQALRDFNIPKIVTEDVPVFLGLIGDLFPALDVPRKKDAQLETVVREAVTQLKLQPEENFILKVLQLEDLLQVRHSVFVIGGPGTGKTSVCQTLLTVYQLQKLRPLAFDLNPKAVTNDELFGTINPSTREWKDGLLSSLMRDLVNAQTNGPKWIILDGDIDPMWIESLNTVMDDNRVLTLASRERISLTPSVRLVFEISSLVYATPATVSRAGVLYLNPSDLSWNPYVVSWIDKRQVQSEKANLIILFDKYIPSCLDAVKRRFKTIIPLPDINYIQTLCCLLDCLLTPSNAPPDSPKELYELYFVFASVWAFGGTLAQDQITDQRSEFSRWFVNEFKSVKFPNTGTVFDFFIENKKLVLWSRKTPNFEPQPDEPLHSMLVPTKETNSVRFLLDVLLEHRHPVMLVGANGCGKTVLVKDKLQSLDDMYQVVNVPFNYYTTSEMLQRILEKALEKKAGRNYGPQGQRKLIYFIDDFNIPEVDPYGTAQPHTIIRQHIDYGHWYDRNKLTPKEVHNCQYVVCMCPTSGSFTINPRLQRHFCVFSVPLMSAESLKTVFGSILREHLNRILPEASVNGAFQNASHLLVTAAIAMHEKVCSTFYPTALKFHYCFNLRDLSNVFQGLMFSSSESVSTTDDLITLWLHETQRVYRDKLVDNIDIERFDKLQLDILRRNMEMEDQVAHTMLRDLPIHCHFANGIGTCCYLPVRDKTQLIRILQDALDAYNDIYPAMDLVLFKDAINHICRITRILESPCGNALLVGVGGSGKQSLASLAAYICNLQVFQLTLHSEYDISDFKTDLANLYLRAGVKNIGTMFLMTDAHVADERFLVLVNDMLASGDISDLFPESEIDNIISAVKPEVKSAGMFDTKENCWKFFIEKVRRKLKIVLCFSPAGSVLRSRSRRFPTITNCTCIDWFHPWPQEALISVCHKFLSEIDILEHDCHNPVADFMAYAYESVNEVSQTFLLNERRYIYSTPKSFLEHIKMYKTLLHMKHKDMNTKIHRLESGLQKLVDTSKQVDDLKTKLAEQEVDLQKKTKDIDNLIATIRKETEKVTREKFIAAEEERKVSLINEEVAKKQKECEEDLARAEPALVAAQEALNTLNRGNLTELRTFGSPPIAVRNVTAAVMILLATDGKIPKDLSWRAAKLMMNKVDNFLDSLINFDKNNIHENSLKSLQTFLRSSEFNPEVVVGKSQAAAGLCSWVINVVKYYEVYCDVEPKRRALALANAEYKAAKEKLNQIQEKVSAVEATLSELRSKCNQATEDKLKCQEDAERTAFSIHLANRLLGGLGSERSRWAELASVFRNQEKTLVGDVLLASAFVSYLGPFTRYYRLDLLDSWRDYFELKSDLLVSENVDPVSLLIYDTTIAQWNNDSLPGDRVSVENATIFACSLRWPFIIDPQIQAITWIKKMYKDNLKVVRLYQKGYLDVIEEALIAGQVVLIENIEETIDPLLHPLIACNLIKKGKALKLGVKEVAFNPDFRLILHTKLVNPHYRPEIQAQTTLINFTVTMDGLEDQLLAEVVRKERPDLEKTKALLCQQQNEFKILLKELEDSLLCRLSAAEGNLVGDVNLVESLEETKKMAAETEERAAEARRTEKEINKAREIYRPAAARAALMYFVIRDLANINPMYLFSLKAFKDVFHKAIQKAEECDDIDKRVEHLVEAITHSVFVYTNRGLFETDKVVFTTHMLFQILRMKDEISAEELEFLLQYASEPNIDSPVDFIPSQCWAGIRRLSALDEFHNLERDIEAAPKRWRKFVESECPEGESLPQEWKGKNSFQKLCIVRCLRPDRITYAIRTFIEEKLGNEYVVSQGFDIAQALAESDKLTPIFFILSPSVDPLADVESFGKKKGFSSSHENFHNVSLGQGQETVAENAIDIGSAEGHWVILQNIHLVKGWLPTLEKKLEQLDDSTHEDFRLFISANPPESAELHIIPQGILESSVKVTNEPPKGMMANLHKALDNFSQETLETSSKESEFKSLLFTLCFFHAVVTERKKFGPQGWNYPYPFSDSDLTISASVLFNHLESSTGVPWEDLRFLFGEIMYGGHITDDWDRRLCSTYLERFFNSDQLDQDIQLCPGFSMPPIGDYKSYHKYITENLPPENPSMYGLHCNAEIGFLTDASESLLRCLQDLQPRHCVISKTTGLTKEEKVRQVVDDISEKLPPGFSMIELYARAEDMSPFTTVALQECERMNCLFKEIRASLREMDLGIKGELPFSSAMEEVEDSIATDCVPQRWINRAYPSLAPLASWFIDLLQRYKALERWVSTDFRLPPTVWLGGLFSPKSFLTAVIQTSGRKYDLPLDKLSLHCDVTKKCPDEFLVSPREGAYISGVFMEGARWDSQTGCISDSFLKDLHPAMPVIFLKAVLTDKQDARHSYICPMYRTRQRGCSFVWEFPLHTEVHPSKWIIAGVALLLQV